MAPYSVVEYFGIHERYSCGYCKCSDTSCSHGMWGHCLTTQDYQDLINRGWRRSGKYCYKPVMPSTCCPQYAIRCEALKFKLSKSQKKILKRMKKFLIHGQSKDNSTEAEGLSVADEHQPMDCTHIPDLRLDERAKAKDEVSSFFSENIKSNEVHESELEGKSDSHKTAPAAVSISSNVGSISSSSDSVKKEVPKHRPAQGADPNKPRCRKAKDIRRERKKLKLLKSGITEDKTQSNQKCLEKNVEDFISEANVENPCHRLELRLVPCNSNLPQFSKTFEQSYSLYQKYQTNIHMDPPEKCSRNQFTRFLVNNPFQFSEESPSTQGIYGSYHQQYWLDDKLIAVGVLDILPNCISSVYLYYDPEYGFLSLGTYAALREIAFLRELNKKYQDLIYYYMGFYIHSCPKMKYKGSYFPSFLLCPETYIFKPIESCISLLNASKYARLEEDSKKGDDDGIVSLDEVMVLHKRQAMSFTIYTDLNRSAENAEEVREYANLIGKKCYRRILLYRSS